MKMSLRCPADEAGTKQSLTSGLLRRGVYPEPAEGLLAMTGISIVKNKKSPKTKY